MSSEAAKEVSFELPLQITIQCGGKSLPVVFSAFEAIGELRAVLRDSPETCEYTSYNLELNGVTLSDNNTFSDYAELLTSNSFSVRLVPANYDEQSAREHVRRLREVLVNPPLNVLASNFPDLDAENKAEKKRKGKKLAKADETFLPLVPSSYASPDINLKGKAGEPVTVDSEKLSLMHYIDEDQIINKDVIECVRSISFSGWNPVPGNRRLRGDLFYLEISTLEGQTLHVTANVEGFFVNNSTQARFDPSPSESPYKSHTLSELLKRASPQFNSRFSRLLTRKVHAHPSQLAPIPEISQNQPWLVSSQALSSIKYDQNRSEDAANYGFDPRNPLRDWNEDFQVSRELPASNMDEQLQRDSLITRQLQEFNEAAIKGAQAIVHGHILPTNPTEPERLYVYIYNNIFFSSADIDARDQYAELGGDETYRKQVAHDVRNIQYLLDKNPNGVGLVATTVVDYRGHRILAQGIIPGVLQGEKGTQLVYGSMMPNEPAESKPEFHKHIGETIAESFNLAEHTVVDVTGKKVPIYTAFDTKGIVGLDARTYLLEVHRLTPRDANYPDPKTHYAALLRRELIQSYTRKLVAQKAEKMKENKDNEDLSSFVSKIRYNVDVFTGLKLGDDEKKIKEDEEAVKNLAKFLVDEVIPAFVKSVQSGVVVVFDGASLTQAMHERGINMRYLGQIAQKAKKENVPYLEHLCVEEMITRAAKHIFRQVLRETPEGSANKKLDDRCCAAQIAKFLNSLLGPHSCGDKLRADQLETATKVLQVLDEERAARIQEARTHVKEHESKIKEIAGEKKDPVHPNIVNRLQASYIASKAISEAQAKAPRKSKSKKDENVIRLPDGSRAPMDRFAPANLWQAIRQKVQALYNYTLPNSISLTPRQKLTLLRNVCLKTGLQVAARDYNFNITASSHVDVFTVDDVMDVKPIAKTLKCNSMVVQSILNRAITMSTYDGNQADIFQQAIHFVYGVYGPQSREAAEACARFAEFALEMGDIVTALDMQVRSTILFQRIVGADHPDTATAHMTLAQMYHAIASDKQFNKGREIDGLPDVSAEFLFELAVRHCKRALYLTELVCGANHPATVTALNNYSVLRSDSVRFGLPFFNALPYLQQALQRSIAAQGNEHLILATLYHQVALAQALTTNFREAIENEKKAKNLYTAILGAKSPEVVRSGFFISTFTEYCVKSEKAGEISNLLPEQLAKHHAFSWLPFNNTTLGQYRPTFSYSDLIRMLQQVSQQQPQESEPKDDEKKEASSPSSNETDEDSSESPAAPNSKAEKNRARRLKLKQKAKGH